MKWYVMALKRAFDFSGRSQRMEYWIFALGNTILSMGAAFIDVSTGMFSMETGMGPVSGLLSLVLIIPGLAVTFRRLHDTDRSAWWLLIAFVPLIGAIWLLVLMVMDSSPGNNDYGPNPKGA